MLVVAQLEAAGRLGLRDLPLKPSSYGFQNLQSLSRRCAASPVMPLFLHSLQGLVSPTTKIVGGGFLGAAASGGLC